MKNKKKDFLIFPDICVCCGGSIPEGRIICAACEDTNKSSKPTAISNSLIKALWDMTRRKDK